MRQNLGLVQEYLLNSDLQQRVKTGYKISPVLLDLTSKNVILVGLGSYLVNALVGCGDCHTNPTFLPSGNPFKDCPSRSTSLDTLQEARSSARSCHAT